MTKNLSKKSIFNRKILFVTLLCIFCSLAFAATSGATYFGSLISTLDDFFSDVKKVLVSVAVLFIAISAIRALASQDSQNLIVNLVHSLFIVAIIGVIVKIIVAVGGATIDENVLKNIQTKNAGVLEKNIEAVYEKE